MSAEQKSVQALWRDQGGKEASPLEVDVGQRQLGNGGRGDSQGLQVHMQ